MGTYLAGMLFATLRANAWADVIQVQQILYPAAAVALLEPLLRRPLVVRNAGSGQFGGVQLMHRMPFGKRALNLIARQATAISLNSEMTAEMRAAGFRRLVEIPNGVAVPAPTTDSLKRAARQSLGLDGPTVLYVGRFDDEKGVDVLIRAWQRLQTPHATLVLVGDGPERTALKHLHRDGTNAESIRFAGPSEDVAQYYQAADLFALPSRSEGISNALLEAMGSGIPVVATAVGGNREVIAAPSVGKLVAPGDDQALAAAIQNLLAVRPLRDALGKAGRSHIEAYYSAERMLDSYERLYRTLTHG
jgi:glycosyltransferase involved in cell wall biosynthesis